MFDTPPKSFEELLERAKLFRHEIAQRGNGLRWCWIAEWSPDDDAYYLGTKIEGQATWTNYSILQRGSGQIAHDWIDRLNEIEGITPDEHRQIWNSGSSSANACLSEDETEVVLILRGVTHELWIAPTSGRPGYVFKLENDLALQLFRGLHSIHQRHIRPHPSDCVRDVAITEDDGVITFCVPGDMEIDPHDEHCFALTIVVQTAADLLDLMPESFGLDIQMLESPEDFLG